MSTEVNIRGALEQDAPTILRFIKELAAYQNEPDGVTIDEDTLRRDGFGGERLFKVLIAEVNGKDVGMAFYYARYSTWRGKVMYLEDIYVEEASRNLGIGGLLMDELETIARLGGCVAMSWAVIDWNEDAIRLYERRGASVEREWLTCFLELK